MIGFRVGNYTTIQANDSVLPAILNMATLCTTAVVKTGMYDSYPMFFLIPSHCQKNQNLNLNIHADTV